MAKSTSQQMVLIATDNINEAQYISDELNTQGYKTAFCEFDGKTLKGTPYQAPDAVLLVFSDYIERTPKIVSALRKHFSPKTPPFIGALTRNAEIIHDTFDTVIFPPAHISQIANRVSSMIRLGQMEREINRRIVTLKEDFDEDYTLSEAAFNQSFKILFIGKATPDFMVIINALQTKNVEVVAAFTSFSAFDYLHDGEFDAVVMNALEQSEPALTISETMRRNAKLYNVPTLFLVDSENFSDHDLAYQKGARDIISTNAETEEISGRILELANYHRIHSQLKDEFESISTKCIDINSGVFNEAFFRGHLKRIIADMKSNTEKLTLIAIKATPNSHTEIPTDKINAAMSQVGQMIKNLVRMQDVTARLSEDIFIIAFPEQGLDSVNSVVERLEGIVDCAAFDSDDAENGPFTVSLNSAIVTHMGHESSDEFIAHTVSELTGQSVDHRKVG